MRAPLSAVASLLLAGSASAGFMVALGDVQLECHETAPLDNWCEDCCADFDGEAYPTVTLFPYEGRLVVRLKAVDSSDAWTWFCEAAGAKQAPVLGVPLGTCTEEPSAFGRLRGNDIVRLDCFAYPLDDPPVEVPPAGPYICSVLVPENDES